MSIPFLKIATQGKCAVADRCMVSCALAGSQYGLPPTFSTKVVEGAIEIHCDTHRSATDSIKDLEEILLNTINGAKNDDKPIQSLHIGSTVDESNGEGEEMAKGGETSRHKDPFCPSGVQSGEGIRIRPEHPSIAVQEKAKEESLSAESKTCLVDFPSDFRNFSLSKIGGKFDLQYMQEYQKSRPRIVSIDFDGVIHKHEYVEDFSTWERFFEPMKNAQLCINTLVDAGFLVCVNTLRKNPFEVIEWLTNWNFLVHSVNGITGGNYKYYHECNGILYPENWGNINPWCGTWSGKLLADVYIDDNNLEHKFMNRGVLFSWPHKMHMMYQLFPEQNWPIENLEHIFKEGGLL